MHISTHSLVILGLLGGIHAVDIDLSDDSGGSSSFATCQNINAGDCCTLTNGDTQPFQSIIIRGLRSGQVGGAYGNQPAGSCNGDPCASAIGDGVLSCGAVYGGKWANGLGGAQAQASASSARAAPAALRKAPNGENKQAKLHPGGRHGRPGRRSLDSADPPRNVGAVPNRPQNVGATPNDGPKNVGAVPNRPHNVGATPYEGPKNVGATPYDPWQDDSDQLEEGGNNVGATPNSPWWQWLRGWGFSKAKREVGRTVAPNRVTISGHTFDLESMSNELRSEMLGALFNHTRFEDLARGLMDFEVKDE